MTSPVALVALRGGPDTWAEAEASLTPEETTHLRRLKVPKRREDWLLGRLAAKRAASSLLAARVAPSGLAIVVGPTGAPTIQHAVAGLPCPDVSISHSDGCAVAVAAFHPVGVDLEVVRPMPPGSGRFYLTATEQAWLETEPWGPSGPLAVWALKEAGFKAVQGRCGLLTRLTLEPGGSPSQARLTDGGVVLEGHLAEGAAHCLAVAVPAQQADLLAGLDLAGVLASL